MYKVLHLLISVLCVTLRCGLRVLVSFFSADISAPIAVCFVTPYLNSLCLYGCASTFGCVQVSKAEFKQKGESFDNSKRLKVNDARVKVRHTGDETARAPMYCPRTLAPSSGATLSIDCRFTTKSHVVPRSGVCCCSGAALQPTPHAVLPSVFQRLGARTHCFGIFAKNG